MFVNNGVLAQNEARANGCRYGSNGIGVISWRLQAFALAIAHL